MHAKNIALYNPSISSMNEGDHIIFNSASEQLRSMFPDSRFVDIPTQTSVSRKVLKWFSDVDVKFVCGTNLLKYGMLIDKKRGLWRMNNVRQWDVTLSKANLTGPVVLMGCGWHHYQKNKDLYSKLLWNRLLSKKYMHSVRDEYTQKKLKEIGINNTIVTGCPTLWNFTSDFCAEIPKSKAKNVITTITNYYEDICNDKKMMNVLCSNYDKIFLWLQGHQDNKYLLKLGLDPKVKIIEGNVSEFDKLLVQDDNIEYVGTRLHGGIRALQLKKRTTIIAIDNRAIEMGKDFNLNIFLREKIDGLADYLNSMRPNNIEIPIKEIQKFKQQFETEV